MKAIWNGKTIAESDQTVVVESNHYFPADAIVKEHFADSDTTSHCPWKGTAHYYSIIVDGEVNTDAAWYYPDPEAAAQEITGRIAFWRGVEVSD